MKVVILSSGVPSQRFPMIGLFAFDQAKALKELGLDVCILSVDFRSIRRKRRWGYYSGNKEGVVYHEISIPIGPIKLLLRIVGRFSILYLYKKVFKRKPSPDIIHAHFTEMGDLAYVLGKKYHIPYVITEHSSLINEEVISPYLKDMALLAYRNAEKVFVVSSALASRVKTHTNVDPIIIPNIIDTSLFAKCVRIPHQGFRLVTTSNLIPLKRTMLVLKALKSCKDEGYVIHLDVIGDGVSKQSLIDYTNENNLSSSVCFYGMLNRESIVNVYSKADCFVLASSTETFGVAYVEAMAAGLPVIATRCGGPEDFVCENNGIKIDVDNVEQLKEAIIYMHKHHTEFKEKSIKEFVVNHFSPEVVAKQIMNEYDLVLKNIQNERN